MSQAQGNMKPVPGELSEEDIRSFSSGAGVYYRRKYLTSHFFRALSLLIVGIFILWAVYNVFTPLYGNSRKNNIFVHYFVIFVEIILYGLAVWIICRGIYLFYSFVVNPSSIGELAKFSRNQMQLLGIIDSSSGTSGGNSKFDEQLLNGHILAQMKETEFSYLNAFMNLLLPHQWAKKMKADANHSHGNGHGQSNRQSNNSGFNKIHYNSRNTPSRSEYHPYPRNHYSRVSPFAPTSSPYQLQSPFSSPFNQYSSPSSHRNIHGMITRSRGSLERDNLRKRSVILRGKEAKKLFQDQDENIDVNNQHENEIGTNVYVPLAQQERGIAANSEIREFLSSTSTYNTLKEIEPEPILQSDEKYDSYEKSYQLDSRRRIPAASLVERMKREGRSLFQSIYEGLGIHRNAKEFMGSNTYNDAINEKIYQHHPYRQIYETVYKLIEPLPQHSLSLFLNHVLTQGKNDRETIAVYVQCYLLSRSHLNKNMYGLHEFLENLQQQQHTQNQQQQQHDENSVIEYLDVYLQILTDRLHWYLQMGGQDVRDSPHLWRCGLFKLLKEKVGQKQQNNQQQQQQQQYLGSKHKEGWFKILDSNQSYQNGTFSMKIEHNIFRSNTMPHEEEYEYLRIAHGSLEHIQRFKLIIRLLIDPKAPWKKNPENLLHVLNRIQVLRSENPKEFNAPIDQKNLPQDSDIIFYFFVSTRDFKWLKWKSLVTKKHKKTNINPKDALSVAEYNFFSPVHYKLEKDWRQNKEKLEKMIADIKLFLCMESLLDEREFSFIDLNGLKNFNLNPNDKESRCLEKAHHLQQKIKSDLRLFTNQFVHFVDKPMTSQSFSETKRRLEILSHNRKLCKLVYFPAGNTSKTKNNNQKSNFSFFIPHFCVFNPEANQNSKILQEFQDDKDNIFFVLVHFFYLCKIKNQFQDYVSPMTETNYHHHRLQDVLLEDLFK